MSGKKFTLVELLVVIAIIGILASMLMPALKKAKDKAHETSCSNKERQIMQVLIFYQDDFNDYYPQWRRPTGPTTVTTNMPWVKVVSLECDYIAPPVINKVPQLDGIWFCPENVQVLEAYNKSAPTAYWEIEKHYTSYALPRNSNLPRNALGGGMGFNKPPVKNTQIKIPSEVSALLEVNGSNGRPAFSIGCNPSFPDLMGRHSTPGLGLNIAFADGHVEYFSKGMSLLTQWKDYSNNGGQSQYPFNTDLE